MTRIPDRLVERRKYVRLRAPLILTYTAPDSGTVYTTVTKDISADGLRFETKDITLKEGAIIELKLNLPGTPNPVHAQGKIIWKRKLSLEDDAPFDAGIEFVSIEEDNKNTFLKFLCDLIYNLPRGGVS
jgi:c-di-GMP-binding flagellar brake protein YcgR